MSEEDYELGHRAALTMILGNVLHHLNYSDNPEITKTKRTVEQFILEREQAIQVLRRLCAEYGDNDWDEELHLADVIDKHLGRYLEHVK